MHLAFTRFLALSFQLVPRSVISFANLLSIQLVTAPACLSIDGCLLPSYQARFSRAFSCPHLSRHDSSASLLSSLHDTVVCSSPSDPHTSFESDILDIVGIRLSTTASAVFRSYFTCRCSRVPPATPEHGCGTPSQHLRSGHEGRMLRRSPPIHSSFESMQLPLLSMPLSGHMPSTAADPGLTGVWN